MHISASAEKYNYDRSFMLTERTSRVERYIMSDPSYVYVITTCTAVENAITSYLGQKGIKRDYTHLTDVGRLIASYVWLEDEPEKASYYLTLYREQAANILADKKNLSPVTVRNDTGW